MNKRQTFLVFLVIAAAVSGCARVEKVRALEGDKDVAYDSLGTLEVKRRVPFVRPTGILWSGVEVLTLSLAKTPSRADQYKKSLRSKLAQKAKKRYGADGVIKVEYWPDPASSRFPEGYLYARGEMIRYRKFPAAQPQL